MLNTSVFNGTNDEYKIEPGTQEDIEVLQLLKIPGYGAKGDADDTMDQNINDDMGALADKEAMDNLVQDLMSQNSQFIIEIGMSRKLFQFRMNDPVFTVGGQQFPNPNQSNQSNCCCCGDPFKSAKDIKSCHFCALQYCAKCRIKQRAYPMNPTNVQIKKNNSKRGSVSNAS